MLTNVKPAAVETNASKRARVLARLHEPDAATMSQRALARELGVTQPFIYKVRRLLAAGTTAASAEQEPLSTAVYVCPHVDEPDAWPIEHAVRLVGREPAPGLPPLTPQQIRDGWHDTQLGRTRRMERPQSLAGDWTLHEWDPYDDSRA